MSQTTEFRGVQTRVEQGTSYIRGFYRNTMVAKSEWRMFDPSSTVRVTLNTGGWRTDTTKMRMNQFSAQFCGNAFRVYQDKGDWFVLVRGNEAPYVFEGNTITFDI
jgi:hypothetical protein